VLSDGRASVGWARLAAGGEVAMAKTERGRLVERLEAIVAAEPRLVVGLSSGTSFDGIDAALISARGFGPELEVELLHFACAPFSDSMRTRIARSREASAEEVARLNFDLGVAFGDAALAAIAAAGLTPSDVHLVGSHGQTIYHEPPEGERTGVTLQIGEADVIAARTGLVTVSDFRTADVAAGGSGAPLIPLADWLLFRDPDEVRLLVNLGGIANVTYVTPEAAGLVAFDTGPGNALLDEILGLATGGADRFDRDGERALRGRPDTRAVEEFLKHPYFSTAPPKSTGKETFGSEAVRDLARLAGHGGSIAELDVGAVDSLLATAAAVTARSVRNAMRFLPEEPAIARVAVSGGGVRNGAVMSMLSELFAPCPVVSLSELGMDPDAKEAVGFALLANETVAGRAGNVPAATGAARPVVLGKLSPGF
jgi:anhydro-N-acetylmuramic acid kinase